MAGGACSLDAMDVYEATKAVFARVHAVDPDNASKIVGMLLIQDDGERELIRLAFGPDHLLHSFVAGARAELAAKPSSPPSPVLGPLQSGPPWGLPSPGRREQAPFAGDQVGYDGGGEVFYPEDYDCWSPASGARRRSFSPSDAEAAAAWRPCLYYARGHCKNGASCRFLHGLPEDDGAAAAVAERELVMRARALAAARPPQLAASAFPFSPPPRGLSFLLQQQQQQSEPQRAPAAMLLGGEETHRFAVRSPRLNRGGLMTDPVARQIYLTFPADSTFTEEDVSNYFSMFGAVQDVRIPYQQKRMFGFVTFVYPETVRIILSKGNPHFVCDARVLVKPYKEKGKVPDKYRKLQHPHHGAGEFAGCTAPTGLLRSMDPFDLQRPKIGPGMIYGNIANQEAFVRRKLEEQQQAAELQHAIELQGRRFMGLQLLDHKSRGGHHLGSPTGSSMSLGQTDSIGSINANGNGNVVHWEDVAIQDNKLNSGLAMSAPASSAMSAPAEGRHEDQQEVDGDGTPNQAVNPGEEEKRDCGPGAAAPNAAFGFQESGVEHILPDSLFASPTKDSIDTVATARDDNFNDSSPHHVASSLFPPTSSLERPPYNSCFFQVPRFSFGHEAIGL
ncbi:hypothetical protein ACP70R_021647 [Stipagrostis hirtigluma subsp. patula]